MQIEDPYCDFCEVEGHTFRTCPARDDYGEDFQEEEDAREEED